MRRTGTYQMLQRRAGANLRWRCMGCADQRLRMATWPCGRTSRRCLRHSLLKPHGRWPPCLSHTWTRAAVTSALPGACPFPTALAAHFLVYPTRPVQASPKGGASLSRKKFANLAAPEQLTALFSGPAHCCDPDFSLDAALPVCRPRERQMRCRECLELRPQCFCPA